jgi:hypothetical protein
LTTALGSLCALLLLSAHAHAHLPALFGRDFVRWEQAGQMQPESSPSSDEAGGNEEGSEPGSGHTPGQSLPDQVDADPYKDKIKDVEATGGPYADGLVEPLISLGQYYQSIGATQDAIDLYRRALHVARVNDGLINTRQLPVLRQLMAIYRSTDDRYALDASYEYFFRLQDLGAPPYTQDKMDAIFEYLNWQREAYTTRLDGTARNRLLQAFEVNERILSSMAAAPEFDLVWYQQLASSQIHHLYLLLGDDPVEDQLEPLLSGVNHGGLIRSEDMVRRRIEHIQRTGVSIGATLLADLIDRSESAAPQERAALWVELGDWYQWNSQLKRANEAYGAVVSMLRESGQDALIEQWLGEPVELPDESAVWLQRRDREPADRAVVAVRYDVSARGDVSNTEVVQMPEEASGEAIRLQRMLRDTHFRPRLVSGEPEVTTGVQRYYKLID